MNAVDTWQVHMVSYQCSPLSTPDGIVGTFHQCAKLQENQDLNKFVSVVVLDEVGLAEDSPRMPLKVAMSDVVDFHSLFIICCSLMSLKVILHSVALLVTYTRLYHLLLCINFVYIV